MKPTLYRARPVDKEAVKWTGRNSDLYALADWMGRGVASTDDGDGVIKILLDTPEGRMLARPGDYIVKGIQGEFYPVDPEVFEESYMPLEGTA